MGQLIDLPDAEVRAFLRAIHDNPADGALRLVFADWLEDHGDPRAGLLRGGPLPPGDAGHDLLAEWSDIPGFDPFASVNQDRGLLRVGIRGRDCDRIDTGAYAQLHRAAWQGWVARIGIHGGSPISILKAPRAFRRLVASAAELWIANEAGDDTDDCLKGVRRLSNLTSLELRRCQLTDAGLAHLRGHARLRIVALDGVFTAVGRRHLRTLPRLEQAVLSGVAVDLGRIGPSPQG